MVLERCTNAVTSPFGVTRALIHYKKLFNWGTPCTCCLIPFKLTLHHAHLFPFSCFTSGCQHAISASCQTIYWDIYQNINHPIHVSVILDKALYEMSFAFKKETLDQVNPLVKNKVQEIIGWGGDANCVKRHCFGKRTPEHSRNNNKCSNMCHIWYYIILLFH